LIAIACGNVRYRAFPEVSGKTWKSGIWAEPELIDAAYWEFSEDTGRCGLLKCHRSDSNSEAVAKRFLAAEENLVTPYRFGVYDLLVLPPSFPYGGMVCTFLPISLV
jgi:leukotriene-A4 hydrolase